MKVRIVKKEKEELVSESEGLDLIINSKLKRIQDLEKKISKLIEILKDLQQAYRDKVKVQIRKPTADELLNWCGDAQNAIKGKKEKA